MNINIFINSLVIPFIIIILNWRTEFQYVNIYKSLISYLSFFLKSVYDIKLTNYILEEFMVEMLELKNRIKRRI